MDGPCVTHGADEHKILIEKSERKISLKTQTKKRENYKIES
jgi:hypothetical protein